MGLGWSARTRAPAGLSGRVLRAVGISLGSLLLVVVLIAVAPFGQAMSWNDTEQTRAVRAWLAASSAAPGAEGYVDGLSISFLVRADEWTKETFGTLEAECAVSIDDLSGCDDRSPSADRPG